MNTTFHTSVVIPGYHLVELLYCGNRTLVYRGIRLVDDQAVAVKLLQQEYPKFHDLLQFRNQYILAKNLYIPGIVRPYNLEPYRNSYALVMEDFGGVSLRDYVQNQALEMAQVLEIALQLADILHDLHACRVIHKDIKPANILIHPETKQVKLIDFSIASLLPKETQEIKNPNRLEGTLAYISPEQTGRMNRGIDYRSDFYALGVTLFELLARQLPFESDDAMELVHCHIAKQPSDLTEFNIPEAAAQIVAKLMAKNAEDRYQSALGLKYDLEICLHQLKETGKIEPFEIGRRDLCDRFTIPEKLYGRETEVQTLLEAFDRIANPQGGLRGVELMLIAGFSGIGKTAVVNEVHKPITRQKGYFIKGKFDQFNRNIPFSAFVQAFRDLIGQLLCESDAQLEIWKTKILEAVGENGQVLIEVIPELEIIIGKQPPAVELSGAAAQNRFNLLLQKFIAVFTTKEHPLVMFLDDLQWSDSASLQLMKLLMEDNSYLLLLGAYRDNEVSPAHPFILTVESLKKAGKTVNTIALAPLEFKDTNQLVAETLKCAIAIAQPLTELIVRKTQGNPFFTTQFLKALHEDGQITFNRNFGYWECDLAQVKALSLTDDVVEFMAHQLQKLPAQTQEILQLAACIGNSFDLETLAIVSERSPADAAAALWKALQEGLILPQSEVYKFYLSQDRGDVNTDNIENVQYRFLHDRVQQAAYSLIPETERAIAHYQIGQLLLQQISPSGREERIFELVNQLNYGISLIADLTERDNLAQLNLTACRKARAATAYQAAREYATAGLQLLGKDAWQRQYHLTLALHELAAEVAWLCGEFEPMEQWIEAVLQATQIPLEQVNVYQVKIQALAGQNKLSESIATGQALLHRLGVHLPDSPTPDNVQQAMQEIAAAIGERPVEELFHLPKMLDPQQIAILQIAVTLTPTCYSANSPFFPLAIALQVKCSIQFGNSPISAFGYATYGILLNTVLQEVELAAQFGRLAYRLALEPDAKSCRSAALAPIGLFLHHRTSHLRETLPILQEGYQVGVETGALDQAAYNGHHFCLNVLWSGHPLAELEPQIGAYQQQLLDFNQITMSNYCSIYWKTALMLLERSEYQAVSAHQEELLSQKLFAKDLFWVYKFYLHRFTVSFLLGNIPQAEQEAAEARCYLKAGAGTIGEAVFYFYDSLTALATVAEDSALRETQWQRVQDNQEQLKHWAHYAPMNHQHKVDLVEAEKCRVLGKNYEAGDWYDRAITGAKENGYIQEQALANELAAKFYLDWGKEKVAAGYMLEAYYCYAKWGALAKTSDLEKRYPQLLTPILQTEKLRQDPHQTITQISTETVHTSSTGTTSVLDLAAAIKASQTLSREIELEQLLSTLMRVVMENAGASRGALILLNDQQWQVVVHCPDAQTCTLEPTPLDESPYVPLSIINRVNHTKEVLVLDAAIEQSAFAADPYLMSQRPQSLLCSPLLNQGKLVGIVYLENNLATGAFSRDRVELLNMICSQAAISLENARLYQQLEDYSHTLEIKVAERTAQLQAAQKQMVAQEKLASLGTLTAGIAHELRNPLNFVNNYAESSVELTQEVLEELENPTPDQEYIQELLTDLKDNAATIHHHGQRTENIIRTMMEHAKSGTDAAQRQNTDLNQLLTEAIQLVYHSQRALDPHVNIAFQTQYDDSIGKLEVIPNALSRALINLLDNACYAVRTKQKKGESNFTPKIEIATTNCGNSIEIRLRDNGTGITSEIQSKIFEPFFTTKPTGEGTGLGLSLTHDIIVEQHGGTLSVESELNCYTEFRITLPKVAP